MALRTPFFVGIILLLVFVPLVNRFSALQFKTVFIPFHRDATQLPGLVAGHSPAQQGTSSPQYNPSLTHTLISSPTTPSGRYFRISFGEQTAINPNILPHPHWNDTWIIVAQLNNLRPVPKSVFFSELVCTAKFSESGDELKCDGPVAILPIAATQGGNCADDLGYFGWSIGPHDARVFYGPGMPYTIFGSVSEYTCFGMWIQDFRVLMDWGMETANFSAQFVAAKELQRPPPYGVVEKNWFAFWDSKGEMYMHHDIEAKRSFAKLEFDGSVGLDLAPAAEEGDRKCMNSLMPKVSGGPESIHQATNSLSITLCKRFDPHCDREANTYVMTIFHHKTFYDWHGVYEPYVMLFQESTPFGVYGISRKPLWIHGRGVPGQGKIPYGYSPEKMADWNQTEMLFTTSISWKTKGQKYHGYMDDVMFMSFGIEDADTGALDVVAGDLLKDLALCSEV